MSLVETISKALKSSVDLEEILRAVTFASEEPRSRKSLNDVVANQNFSEVQINLEF